MKKNKRSLFILLYLCGSLALAIFVLLFFGRLLGAWIIWDVNSKFPITLDDVYMCLELTWIGPLTGIVLWFFYYRK